MSALTTAIELIRGDRQADRVVPRTGHASRLTVLTSAAMAFLAVFAMALSLATGRLADRWSEALARSSTIRISAPAGELEAQTAQVLSVLAQTPGIASARALSDAEEAALLEPWLGPDLPLADLPVPRLIEVIEDSDGYDGEGLRQRLSAEAPGAVLDDHTRWRRPLVTAAGRLRLLGWLSIGLLGGSMAALITLAAQSALAAHHQVIEVLRLVGASDSYIVRAFVRRFTLRALGGAVIGASLATLAVAALPSAAEEGAFLTGLGFQGAGWLWPATLPPLAAVVAFWATRSAAFRALKGLS